MRISALGPRLALAGFLAAAAAAPARAQPLIADLSSHLIAITTGFSGTEVLLYGATEGEGDVAVVLRGPEATTIVRRKRQIAGIWINRNQLTFGGAPAFYRVASSRPLEEIASPALRARHQLGVEFLRLAPNRPGSTEDVAAFRDGLVRNKVRQGLYALEAGRVSFLGARLFRTRVEFPSDVPTGSYTVEVLLIKGGQVVAAQTTPLFVSKIGVGADLFEFAHRYAAIYGVFAALIAVLAGWGAGTLFRKS